MELCAGLLRQIARPRRLRVGNRQELDGGMLRHEARAQRANAAGADDGDAQGFALNGLFLPRAILTGAQARYGTHDARCGIRDARWEIRDAG